MVLVSDEVTSSSEKASLPDRPTVSYTPCEHPNHAIPTTVPSSPGISPYQPDQTSPGVHSKQEEGGDETGKPVAKVRRVRGRKKGQAMKMNGKRLWEFVRDLLNNPVYNPEYIKWIDKGDKIFRIVQSEAVATLWGRKKKNSTMTYEKFSRAIR